MKYNLKGKILQNKYSTKERELFIEILSCQKYCIMDTYDQHFANKEKTKIPQRKAGNDFP